MNPQGEFIGKSTKVSGGKSIVLKKPIAGDAVVWLSRN
jgi:hypothetical protein